MRDECAQLAVARADLQAFLAMAPQLMSINHFGIRGFAVAAAVLVWTTAVVGGLAYLWAYAAAAGDDGAPPDRWPTGSSLAAASERPTLLVFAHPRCPCTRATIGELAKLMAHCQGRVDARVVFVTPRDAADNWRTTDLWDAAREIPGVEDFDDDGGVEAARFSVATSGHALLYGADGRLLYSGGLTAARGHAGDNPGCEAIESMITQTEPASHHAPVFGCELFGREDKSGGGAKSCCPK